MANASELANQIVGFSIDDEENEELIFDDEAVEDSSKFDLCLVGCFLTEKNINTRAMKTKLADI